MHKNGSDSIRIARPYDIILLLLAGLAVLIIFCILSTSSVSGKRAVIRVDGKEFRSCPLNKDCQVRISPEDDSWENTLTIRHGQADMTGADCPDQICVHHRPVSLEGETIVCLPHKVVVTVE